LRKQIFSVHKKNGQLPKLPVLLDKTLSYQGSYSETDTGKDGHIIMPMHIIISMLRIFFVMNTASFLQDGVILLP